MDGRRRRQITTKAGSASRSALIAVLASGALCLSACTSSGTPDGGGSRAPGSSDVLAPASSAGTATDSPARVAPTPGLSAEPSTAAGAPPTAGPRTATVLGSGDVLIHPPLWQQAHRDAQAKGKSGYDFGPMYASISADVHSADLATCEMETPLAPPEGPFVGWPDFNAPPQVLTALTGVGYSTCTTASNHTLDQGYTGLKRTLDELDASGVRHTGSARTKKEADTPLITTLPNGLRIGQLAYSFNFNGHEPPAARVWEANLIDVPRILAQAKRMKADGADVIVLSLHWGTEYDHLATDVQKQEANALLASKNIDLILGDHAHVVQPAQKIHGKWVFYCMGNQISRHADPIAEGRQGIMPRVTFTEVSPHHFRATRVEAIPTWMENTPNLRLVDLPRALASTSLTDVQRKADTRAHAAIVGYLGAYGAVRDGLTIR